MATQCDEGKGLHYVPVLHYLETLKNGKQVDYGKTGSLIITSLAHYAMPIIRYQIGDFTTLTDKKCDCGRTFPMIEKLDGRTYETINTSVGSLVTVYEFKSIFEKFPTVSDFQIVQNNPELVEVRLKCKIEKLTAKETLKLTRNILVLLECNVNIDIVYVDEVTKLPNGKILRVISQSRYEIAKAAGVDAGSV